MAKSKTQKRFEAWQRMTKTLKYAPRFDDFEATKKLERKLRIPDELFMETEICMLYGCLHRSRGVYSVVERLENYTAFVMARNDMKKPCLRDYVIAMGRLRSEIDKFRFEDDALYNFLSWSLSNERLGVNLDDVYRWHIEWADASSGFKNHYDYLDRCLPGFFGAIGVNWDNNAGIVAAHGDKGDQYKDAWEEAGVPYHHGMAVYMLTFVSPFESEVRNTPDGFVAPKDWVINNYPRFKEFLPAVTAS